MKIEPECIARWRDRAEQYRICADACLSPGTKRAYHVLAQCADSVADHMERKALTISALDPSTSCSSG